MEPLKDFLYEKFLHMPKKYLWVAGVALLWLVFGAFLFINSGTKQTAEPESLFEHQEGIEETKKEDVTEIIEPDEIMVDVKGAVKNPGVYLCDSNARVQDVIDQAGGTVKGANLDVVNLSQKLVDEMVIYIPKVGEEIVQANGINNEAGGNRGEGDSLVSLNHATQADLETLPGIGPKKASSILSYRETNGGFQSIEELKEVDGIGEKTFEQLKSLVKL